MFICDSKMDNKCTVFDRDHLYRARRLRPKFLLRAGGGSGFGSGECVNKTGSFDSDFAD